MMLSKTCRFVLAPLTGFLFSTCSWCGPLSFENSISRGTPQVLQEAHQAYLAGEKTTCLFKIKQTLQNYADHLKAGSQRIDNPPVVDNALRLFERLEDEQKGDPLATDWQLPAALERLQIKRIQRKLPDRLDYGVAVSGKSYASVKELRVTSASGDVVLDRTSQIGEWESRRAPSGEQGMHEFTLSVDEQSRSLPRGLYFIDMTFAAVGDKQPTRWQAWFILARQSSEEAPVLITPQPGETLIGTRPHLRWHNFRSSGLQKNDHRSLWIGITSQAEQTMGKEVYSQWFDHPKLSELRLPTDLPQGPYRVNLSYKESHAFGAPRFFLSQVFVTTHGFTIE